jgi:hypothetical protein
MKTVDIKGKAYVEVNERVKFFRNEKDYEGWAIETELLSNENGVCVFKAIVKDNNGIVKATGHAYEKEDSTFINKTSYIENCETSAVGRALGMLGIGIDTSIASSDEVQNAMANQDEKKSPNGLDFDELRLKYSKMTTDELRKEYVQVKTYTGYSEKQKNAICNIIKKIQESK